MGIAERRAEAEQAVRDAEGELEIAKARLSSVRISCSHPKLKAWTKRHYDGSTTDYTECPDCGMETAR